jgi:hypothetical protein
MRTVGKAKGRPLHSSPGEEARIVEVKKRSFDDQYLAITGHPR